MTTLSPSQIRALQWYRAREAWRAGRIPADKIPAGLGSPATRTIDALVRAGLVERAPHPQQGHTQVVLTPAGYTALEAL